ncbi:MAG: RibD family protein [Caulobacteraceae bacterium]
MSVTLKLATSLDGRIATASGESRWITGEAARAQVHRLRAEHDAVVIGIETALADDPELTVRPSRRGSAAPQDDADFGIPNARHAEERDASLASRSTHPARVVLDSTQRLPLDSKLAQTANDTPTYVVSTQPPSDALTQAGVKVLTVRKVGDGRPELKAAVAALARENLHSLFVEGGGQVAASFIRCGLIDRIEWFRSPIMLGGEGRPCIGALALTALSDAPRFRRVSAEPLGEDLWERYERL